MLRFLPYVVKNLRGHRVRTLMTVVGTAVMTFTFCFVQSIQAGMDQLLEPARRDDRLITFQAYRFCPSVSQLPYPAYEDLIRRVPGVREVLPIKIVVNNCRASLDTVVFHGVPPEKLRHARSLRLVAGDWGAFQSRRDGGALAGKRVADRRGLRVGQPFSVAGVTVVVEGIFASDEVAEENVIYVHLPFLLNQTPGRHQDLLVTSYEVHVANAPAAEDVARRIDEAVRDRYPVLTDTKPRKTFQRQALADVVEILRFTRWLGYLSMGVVAILVGNAVLMAAQDRVSEHAVLQTMGYSPSLVARLMLIESLLVSLAGGICGTLGAYFWLTFHPLTLGVEGVSVDFTFSLALVAEGLGLATGIGVGAGLVPAWQAARQDVPQALRS